MACSAAPAATLPSSAIPMAQRCSYSPPLAGHTSQPTAATRPGHLPPAAPLAPRAAAPILHVLALASGVREPDPGILKGIGVAIKHEE